MSSWVVLLPGVFFSIFFFGSRAFFFFGFSSLSIQRSHPVSPSTSFLFSGVSVSRLFLSQSGSSASGDGGKTTGTLSLMTSSCVTSSDDVLLHSGRSQSGMIASPESSSFSTALAVFSSMSCALGSVSGGVYGVTIIGMASTGDSGMHSPRGVSFFSNVISMDS